jgi:hypothetical protein
MTTARITGGWLPLSEAHLAALGWPEGQMVELEVAEGVLIATPSQAPQPVPVPGSIGGINPGRPIRPRRLHNHF